MRPALLSFAVIGAVASAAVGAALWPHARDSLAVLAAQDEPRIGRYRDQLCPAKSPGVDRGEHRGGAGHGRRRPRQQLRRAGTREKHRARRCADDARERCGSGGELDLASGRRFATGLVTGDADDVASLSGTVAGDLFVFGDIRDVVREGSIWRWARIPIVWCWAWLPRDLR